MQWAVLPLGDKRKVDFCLQRTREFNLGFFCRITQALQGLAVFTKIYPVFFFEFIGKIIQNLFVKVIAAQMRISVGGFYLIYPLP